MKTMKEKQQFLNLLVDDGDENGMTEEVEVLEERNE